MSATPTPPVSVGVLRDSVRGAVDARTIRAVAAEVGISKTGVVKFLEGAKPRAGTMRKLLAWYVRQSGALDADAAQAAIALLVNTAPESQRDKVRAGLLDLLRDAHKAAGTKPPDWLK